MGDASLSLDPVTGSGVIHALNTAKEAASCIIASLNDDDSAVPTYELNRNNACHKYLVELAGYYGLEKRWTEAAFWKRRAVLLQNYLAK